MCENEYDDKEKKISEKKEELRTLRKEIIENDYEEMKMISIMEKQLYERKQMSQFDDWEIITILYEKENMTYQQIGEKYGLSRQRVEQIIHGYN